MIIELINIDDEKVYLNSDNILTFKKSIEHKNATFLYMLDGKYGIYKESPKEIMEIINNRLRS